MIELLIYLAILVIVVMVVWYLLQQMGLPEPAQRIITIALVVVVAIIVIGVLLNFAGMGGIPLRLPRS